MEGLHTLFRKNTKIETGNLCQILEENFGFKEFRPGQLPIIETILSGQDVLGVLPTGGGKSLCYQLPALILPGITVVISPLIALMKDQVGSLEEFWPKLCHLHQLQPF